MNSYAKRNNTSHSMLNSYNFIGNSAPNLNDMHTDDAN